MVPGGSRITCMVYSITCFRGLDLYCTDPAQYLITAGYDLDDLDDLSDLSDLSDLPDLSDLSDLSDLCDLSDLSDLSDLFYLSDLIYLCLLYTSPSPRDGLLSRMPSSA